MLQIKKDLITIAKCIVECVTKKFKINDPFTFIVHGVIVMLNQQLTKEAICHVITMTMILLSFRCVPFD